MPFHTQIQTCTQTNKKTDRRTDGPTDRDRQTYRHRQTDGRTDRQTDWRPACMHACLKYAQVCRTMYHSSLKWQIQWLRAVRNSKSSYLAKTVKTLLLFRAALFQLMLQLVLQLVPVSSARTPSVLRRSLQWPVGAPCDFCLLANFESGIEETLVSTQCTKIYILSFAAYHSRLHCLWGIRPS